jgi:hypothetical protein
MSDGMIQVVGFDRSAAGFGRDGGQQREAQQRFHGAKHLSLHFPSHTSALFTSKQA